jgi:transcriptional regulator with XRE-family HTH domain
MLNTPETLQLTLSKKRQLALGSILCRARKACELSQMELSRQLGYQYSIVSHWENGTQRIPRARLLELQQMLGLSLKELKSYLKDPSVVADEVNPTGSRVIPGLGERLKMLRAHFCYSTTDMALLLDMARTQYNRIENGLNNLTLQQLMTVHQTMKIPYDQILGQKPLLLPTVVGGFNFKHMAEQVA